MLIFLLIVGRPVFVRSACNESLHRIIILHAPGQLPKLRDPGAGISHDLILTPIKESPFREIPHPYTTALTEESGFPYPLWPFQYQDAISAVYPLLIVGHRHALAQPLSYKAPAQSTITLYRECPYQIIYALTASIDCVVDFKVVLRGVVSVCVSNLAHMLMDPAVACPRAESCVLVRNMGKHALIAYLRHPCDRLAFPLDHRLPADDVIICFVALMIQHCCRIGSSHQDTDAAIFQKLHIWKFRPTGFPFLVPSQDTLHNGINGLIIQRRNTLFQVRFFNFL